MLTPLFGEGKPEHVPHLATFDAELHPLREVPKWTWEEPPEA